MSTFPNDLDGRIAIVTGAANGLGRSISEAFVKAGASVVVADMDEGAGEETVDQLGNSAVFQKTDVTNEDELKACVSKCLEKFKRLDCLVNNAGITGPWGPLSELDREAIEQVFRVNVTGPLLGTKHAAPAIAASGGGSIINMSGVAGQMVMGSHIQIAYNISKAAIDHLTRCTAYVLGEKKIRVNAICPGHVLTQIAAKGFGLTSQQASLRMPALQKLYATLQLLPVSGSPDDIARTALFLASDASRFISGQVLSVDGALVHEYANLSQEQLLHEMKTALGLEPE